MKFNRNTKIILLLHLLGIATLAFIIAKLPQLFCPTNIPQSAQPATVNPAVSPNPRTSAKVIRVIDGDTFVISTGEHVRLIGMDTPEMKTNRGTPDCFATEAKDKLTAMINGTNVELEMDISKTDRYGRLLRYVYKDGVMINEQLLKDGYASVFTYPPDVKYADQFLTAEKSARKSQLGLWSKCSK